MVTLACPHHPAVQLVNPQLKLFCGQTFNPLTP